MDYGSTDLAVVCLLGLLLWIAYTCAINRWIEYKDDFGPAHRERLFSAGLIGMIGDQPCGMLVMDHLQTEKLIR